MLGVVVPTLDIGRYPANLAYRSVIARRWRVEHMAHTLKGYQSLTRTLPARIAEDW